MIAVNSSKMNPNEAINFPNLWLPNEAMKERIAKFKDLFKPKVPQKNNEESNKNWEKFLQAPVPPPRKPKTANREEKIEHVLQRKCYEKDKIISLMEMEIGVLYEQIKIMVSFFNKKNITNVKKSYVFRKQKNSAWEMKNRM